MFLDFYASVIIRVVVKRNIKKLVTPTIKIEFIPSGKLSQYQVGFSRNILFTLSRVEKLVKLKIEIIITLKFLRRI